MFFDTLAGIVERHWREKHSLMTKARIFRMEGDFELKYRNDEKVVENFRLPFPVVAIEIASSRTENGQFVIVIESRDVEKRLCGITACLTFGGDSVVISSGEIVALPDGFPEQGRACVAFDVKNLGYWFGGKKRGLVMAQTKPTERLIGALDDAIKYGVMSILAINTPSSFVVEERPLRQTEQHEHMIRRSSNRPHYIVLTPTEIKRRFLYPNVVSDDFDDDDGTSKVRPHERRGHFRRLQSERYKNARGQVIWIEPTWVGPSEAVVGPNRYKVRLDL